MWKNYLHEPTFRNEQIPKNNQKSATKLNGWLSSNVSYFLFCFFENHLTLLFMFACTDHHLKCIHVVFLPSQATLGTIDPTSGVLCVMTHTHESEIKHIPIKQLIYSKYICRLSLQVHCVCCNSHCIRLLTQAAYNKTGFLF